jgi:hypothetical protein
MKRDINGNTARFTIEMCRAEVAPFSCYLETKGTLLPIMASNYHLSFMSWTHGSSMTITVAKCDWDEVIGAGTLISHERFAVRLIHRKDLNFVSLRIEILMANIISYIHLRITNFKC